MKIKLKKMECLFQVLTCKNFYAKLYLQLGNEVKEIMNHFVFDEKFSNMPDYFHISTNTNIEVYNYHDIFLNYDFVFNNIP